jgi:hypothetical protein
MYEESSWLPPNAPTAGYRGIHLPHMPRKPVLRALYQYGPDVELTMFPHSRQLHEVNRIWDTCNETDGVVIKIDRPLEVGYGNKTQIVLATVKTGRMEIIERKVVLRFFDSLYVSPGQLDVIPFGD